MKKNIFKSIFFIFIGMVIGVVLFITLIIFIFIGFSKNPIVVKNNSWLVLDFSGKISESPVSNMLSILSSSPQKMELIKYLKAIENAATDEKIVGIIINGDFTFYSKVHTEEIRNSLEIFKNSGKKVFAWFSSGNKSSISRLETGASQRK